MDREVSARLHQWQAQLTQYAEIRHGPGHSEVKALPVLCREFLRPGVKHCTFRNPSSLQTSCKKVIRLPKESSSVMRMDGSKIFRGIPGNLRGAYIHHGFVLEVRQRQQRGAVQKWREATSSGSVMAVRFITLFSSSSSPNRKEGGRRHRPALIPPGLFRRCVSIISYLSADPGSPSAVFPHWRLRRGGLFGRGLLLFQLVMEAVDGLDHQEHRKGDDEEIQNGGQEVAVFDGNLRSGIDLPRRLRQQRPSARSSN